MFSDNYKEIEIVDEKVKLNQRHQLQGRNIVNKTRLAHLVDIFKIKLSSINHHINSNFCIIDERRSIKEKFQYTNWNRKQLSQDEVRNYSSCVYF